jgi:hypothetical protein
LKVLFIGEGPHELGHAKTDDNPFEPRPMRGLLAALVGRIGVTLTDPIGLEWSKIARFRPDATRAGLAAKVAAAMLLSARRFGCAGTVCVHDCDGKKERLRDMEEGRERGLRAVDPKHRIACGLAVESIEAWTLGAPKSVALVLGLEPDVVRAKYSIGQVETFSERSGKEEKRPKRLLAGIALLVHREDGAELRREIAESTDVAELERNCPEGFKPFAEAVRQVLLAP